jgi:crotonobetainyl-CoA:carnitine CoA-transferase CaiB-like acyl-CoA transferase
LNAPADDAASARPPAAAPLAAALPLAGLRILTFEAFGAGPFGSMYLADLGAEVIKIESRSQGGDATRGMGPFFLGDHDSHFFQTFNLNKRSVCLDLKTADGQQAFRRLVAKSDAVLNNLRGDQPDKLGLTFEALKHTNPRIVCAHLSAYGRDNERRAWPGYDYLMQAEAGYLHVTGEPGSPPARMGLSIVDFMTGITTALALLAALFGAQRSGRGRDVDVSLFDVALHQLSYPGTWYLNDGLVTGRMPRSAHPTATPVQLFRTADGWIFLMCMTEKFWQELMRVIDAPHIAADPRFATMPLRRDHREALTPLLDAVFECDTTARWLSKLQGVLPAAPVHDMAQALENPFPTATGMIRSTPHPLRPDFRTFANPIKLDGQRLAARTAPALGADTDAVLAELGYSDAEIAAMRTRGIT